MTWPLTDGTSVLNMGLIFYGLLKVESITTSDLELFIYIPGKAFLE